MKKIIVSLVLLLNCFVLSTTWASSFVVRKIEIEGLQRIPSETVYSYLPIHEGEVLHEENTGAILSALYKTGFFEHINLTRSGDVLVIHVVERATIGQLKISGNSVIPTDKLTAVMKGLDVAEGRVYNQAVLERIRQGLLNQYYQLGRYNARVNITTTPMERGRVLVKIDISEGLTAKIKRINIIGNHVFSERRLVNQMTVSTPGLFTFFTQSDRYSQEKLDESIESLRNFYLDHGYIKFAQKSSQVSITPDRKSVFITIVIDEGLPYKIKGYRLSGDFVIPREDLQKLITIKPGETFSRQRIVDAEKALTDAMGDKGYVYSTVSLVPTVDEANRDVFVDFNIKPGKRTYVRHIYFSDNAKTNDEVLRRQVQQMEAAPISTSQLEESKRLLNMLPYMRDTKMSLVPVPDHDDQVDVDYKVNENNSAEINGRVGYSQLDRVMLGAGINQKNFLGTGKTVGLNVEASRYQRFYSANYTDPYFTHNGISRNINLTFSKIIPGKGGNLPNSYTSNEYNISDVYSIPIGQEKNVTNRFDIGYGYQNTLINLTNSQTSTLIQDFINRHGRHFQQINLMAGLSRDSRDRAIFPTRGARNAVGLNIFLPVAQSLKYYTLNYSGAWFHPLVSDFILTTRGTLAYGNGFSNARDYPFFKYFYAGGMQSVRGYTPNSLGPRDNLNNSTGGNFLADASLGLILPNYVSDNIRTTLFVDAGNTYLTYDNRSLGGTASGPLRYSTGVQVEWMSMLGPIDISLARALNKKPGDDLKAFDFSLGANFG